MASLQNVAFGQTVIRGGYNRIYARMNGINLVQVPLQGTGIGQPVTCIGASRTGQCLGAGGRRPDHGFPYRYRRHRRAASRRLAEFPAAVLSGRRRECRRGHQLGDRSQDSSRGTQISSTSPSSANSLEGEDGSRIRRANIKGEEQLAYSLDSVPYMTTLNGQSSRRHSPKSIRRLVGTGAGVHSAPAVFRVGDGWAGLAVLCRRFPIALPRWPPTSETNIVTTHVYDMWAALNKARAGHWAEPCPAPIRSQISAFPMPPNIGWSNYNGVSFRFA